MATVSLCMIVKDEEAVLPRCLESVRGVADEIIIVDTGSRDGTKTAAAAYTRDIFDFQWCDDFSAARNFSFSKATKEYVMWLDADDILTEENRLGIIGLKERLTGEVATVMMKYVSYADDGTQSMCYYRERLVKNDGRAVWEGVVHEVMPMTPPVIHVDLEVTHKREHGPYSKRNLRIYEKFIAGGGILNDRQRFYYARELYYHRRFAEAAAELQIYLDSDGGFVENKIEACRVLSACRAASDDKAGELDALLASLRYDAPRAELCCDIGAYFMAAGAYRQAVYWYEQAAAQTRDDTSGAFVIPDCYDFIPYMQLCVCHHRLGDTERSKAYHRLAADIKPKHPSVLYNGLFFRLREKDRG